MSTEDREKQLMKAIKSAKAAGDVRAAGWFEEALEELINPNGEVARARSRTEKDESGAIVSTPKTVWEDHWASENRKIEKMMEKV